MPLFSRLNILGEVYQVNEAMHTFLCAAEDVPDFYQLRKYKILVLSGGEDGAETGEQIECTVFALSGFREELLEEEFCESYSSDEAKKRGKTFVPK